MGDDGCKDIVFVYILVSSGTIRKYWKIGFSKNPSKRLKQLQTATPFKITEYARLRCDNPRQLERKFHDLLRAYKQEGGKEWFQLPQSWMDTILFEIKTKYL